MTRASQTEEELEIFRIFAEVADYEIDPLTIKSEEPPMPDISAYTKNGERLLFELTRLIDAKLLKLLSLSENTEKIIRNHYETLNVMDRKKFDTLYSNVDLYFEFSIGSTLSDRNKIITKAFNILLNQIESDSDFKIEYHPDLMPILDIIRVNKCSLNGPLFNVSRYIRLGDPVEKTISKKLRKNYKSGLSIILLAYINWDFFPNIELIKHSVKLASRHMRKSKIKKIIVFNAIDKKIIFEYPEKF